MVISTINLMWKRSAFLKQLAVSGRSCLVVCSRFCESFEAQKKSPERRLPSGL